MRLEYVLSIELEWIIDGSKNVTGPRHGNRNWCRTAALEHNNRKKNHLCVDCYIYKRGIVFDLYFFVAKKWIIRIPRCPAVRSEVEHQRDDVTFGGKKQTKADQIFLYFKLVFIILVERRGGRKTFFFFAGLSSSRKLGIFHRFQQRIHKKRLGYSFCIIYIYRRSRIRCTKKKKKKRKT